jgi:pilus assembly protein CpaF
VSDGAAGIVASQALAAVREKLHGRLLERVEARSLELQPRAVRRLLIREQALAILREEGDILPQAVLARVVNEVADQVVGLGPLESLLRDPGISEVMVNGPDDVYVETKVHVYYTCPYQTPCTDRPCLGLTPTVREDLLERFLDGGKGRDGA